nr:MAG TPA: SOS-response transcriptional repressor [Caudoviricetes sp.]
MPRIELYATCKDRTRVPNKQIKFLDRKMDTNMTFKELYEQELHKPTHATLFVQRIAKVTKRQEMTVRMWLAGRQQPDELVKSIIAQELGVDANSLFPESNQQI